jgi:hydroxymethylpyrimidine/phosphomethylpyrimidine kinase
MKYRGIALTIAGSDSGGGAGIQADLKTFQAFNVFGVTVITSITAQNTLGVRSIQDIDPEIVGDQIDMIMEDMGCHAAKTGMVSNAEIIEVIADRVKKHRIDKLVIDPVMVSKSRNRLLKNDAQNVLIKKLLPLSYLLTPNIDEAEIISGIKISSTEDVKKAARKITEMGPESVLIKGGHLKEDKAIDILFSQGRYTVFESERIDSKNTHGTGCTISSAITASLSCGENLLDSIRIAKEYITRAIENAPGIGKGFGPLYHRIIPKTKQAFETKAGDFNWGLKKK